MSKKYQRFGLRRENNLSDIINPEVALSNLLNDLAPIGEIFQPRDLTTSIVGIQNTDVRNIDLRELAGNRIVYFDENRVERFVNPLVTIKDQIDNYKLISGDPPFLSGGDGPNAYFIRSGDIQTIDATATGVDVAANNAVEFGPFNFWSNGEFSLPNYLFEDFQDPDGLVRWEGLFAPDIDLIESRLNVTSSGLLLVEVEINGTYETVLNIYAGDRELSYTAPATANVSSIDINDLTKHVGVGDLIAEVNAVDISDQDIRVTSVNITTGLVGLSGQIPVNSGANTILFRFNVGEETITSYFNINTQTITDKIPVKIYNWWPTPTVGDNTVRDTTFNYINSNVSFLPYTYFYKELPTQSNQLPESTEYFFNNYLQPKKNKTSEELKVNDQIVIDYDPPTLVSDKINGTATILSQTALQVSAINLFTTAQVGDYIYVNNPTGESIFQINRKINNSTVVLEGDPDTIDNISGLTAYVIDHMGLVGVYSCDTSNNNVITELSTTFPLFDVNGHSNISNDELISDFAVSTYMMRVTNLIDNPTNVVIDTLNVVSPETLGTGPVFVYRDKGLTDRSKLSFCQGVTSKEVAVQAASGSTTIQLTSVDGSEVGSYAQFDGIIPTGTTVTAANTTANTIDISQATLEILGAGETITLSPDNINREVCNIALNTAPPFEGTERGLRTVTGNEGIELNQITIDSLEMTLSAVATASNTTYSETLDITSNGQTYKLLIV